MKPRMLLCGVALSAIPFLASAGDFPLDFKTLNATEAMSFPGGSGASAALQLGKPADIRKEPSSVSRKPLYGQLSAGADRLCFRIDESKGDRKGYDSLIVDVNQNGDLTDDPVIPCVEQSKTTPAAPRPEMAIFGPIPAADRKKIGDWRPIYFAQMYLSVQLSDLSSYPRNAYMGQLRLKAGWYLETTVELDGVKSKVGVLDGNCNSVLGDVDQPTTYKSGSETNWYFQGGDYFLSDVDRSGKFDNAVGTSESTPFGPLLYLGAKPYKATLSADRKSLTLEPWTEPLAELVLSPHGDQVSGIQVAWENTAGKWQLLQPGVENGKAKVPPGNYRLYTCTLKVKTAAGDTLNLSGYKRLPKDTTKAEAGAATSLKCGSPLEIKVSSQRDTRDTVESGSILRRIAGAFGSSSDPKQLIQASVVGAGNETYSGFYLLGNGKLREPPQPVFTVTTADGKQVGTGNMEFG